MGRQSKKNAYVTNLKALLELADGETSAIGP